MPKMIEQMKIKTLKVRKGNNHNNNLDVTIELEIKWERKEKDER